MRADDEDIRLGAEDGVLNLRHPLCAWGDPLPVDPCGTPPLPQGLIQPDNEVAVFMGIRHEDVGGLPRPPSALATALYAGHRTLPAGPGLRRCCGTGVFRLRSHGNSSFAEKGEAHLSSTILLYVYHYNAAKSSIFLWNSATGRRPARNSLHMKRLRPRRIEAHIWPIAASGGPARPMIPPAGARDRHTPRSIWLHYTYGGGHPPPFRGPNLLR